MRSVGSQRVPAEQYAHCWPAVPQPRAPSVPSRHAPWASQQPLGQLAGPQGSTTAGPQAASNTTPIRRTEEVMRGVSLEPPRSENIFIGP